MLNARPYLGVVLAVCVAVSVCGCVLGPRALRASRVRYNEAIQATTNEQLLLNLVRLQYREAPLFLEVGAVSAQFAFKQTADIDGTINEGPLPNYPDKLALGAGTSFEEKPTVTFTPLQGSEFVTQLLSPVQFDVVVLLSRSGWSIDRVLRLTVQAMNGLDNASGASGPTPAHAPQYQEFAQVSALFRELQKQGLLELGYATRETDLPISLPIERVELLDVVEAANQGYRLRTSDTGNQLIVTQTSRVLLWRVPPQALRSAEVQEIVELLGLDPQCTEYEIRPVPVGRSEGSVPRGQRTRIEVATRSLLGTLFYISQAVEVPEAHRAENLVTSTVTAEGEPFDWHLVTGRLMRVHVQALPPRRTAVAVRHRGYWYYIDDADLTSKTTFSLLSQLFALQAGEVEAVAPVLTLSIGG